jgi:hypothetical protein
MLRRSSADRPRKDLGGVEDMFIGLLERVVGIAVRMRMTDVFKRNVDWDTQKRGCDFVISD